MIPYTRAPDGLNPGYWLPRFNRTPKGRYSDPQGSALCRRNALPSGHEYMPYESQANGGPELHYL